MLYADFDTRQQLAREHRHELAREMRLARRTRPEAAPLAIVHPRLEQVRSGLQLLIRSKASHGKLAEEF
jgi:hypothetical protein